MHTEDYIGEKTGLVLVDPYNDFLSPAGKLWPQAKEVAEEVNLLSNLKSIVDVARRSGIRIFSVPHHRWEPGDYIHWKHATTRQLAGAKNQIFAKGTWGGEWHPDFVPREGGAPSPAQAVDKKGSQEFSHECEITPGCNV